MLRLVRILIQNIDLENTCFEGLFEITNHQSECHYRLLHINQESTVVWRYSSSALLRWMQVSFHYILFAQEITVVY